MWFKLEIFPKKFFYGKNFKLLRKDSDPSYLHVGIECLDPSVPIENYNFLILDTFWCFGEL
jgi:hypothetical protein